MPNIIVEAVTVTITAATAAALTCADTNGLYVGQRGWIVDSGGENNLEIIVVNVASTTDFSCQKLSSINNGGNADLTAYDGGTCYFEKQLVEVPGGGADLGTLDTIAVGKVPAKTDTGFANATTANVPDSTNKRYVTDVAAAAAEALALRTVGALVKIGSDGNPADASVTDAQLATIYAETRNAQVACPAFTAGAASLAMGTGKYSECVIESARTLSAPSTLTLTTTDMEAGQMFKVTCKALTLGQVLTITSASVNLATFAASLTRARAHYFFFDGATLFYDHTDYAGA